jgi:hypothetical protein
MTQRSGSFGRGGPLRQTEKKLNKFTGNLKISSNPGKCVRSLTKNLKKVTKCPNWEFPNWEFPGNSGIANAS